MKNLIIDKISSNTDFIPLFSGEEECAPSHSFGPYIRDYCLIHFCLSGKGTLYDKNGEHKVEAGQFFIIREGETTTYRADESRPWHYIWIATVGKRADELEDCPTVAHGNEDFFGRIKAAVDKNDTNPYIYCAFLYELLHIAGKRNSDEQNDKISSIRRYVKYNYMLDINVESLARIFGFERSYLYRIFKQRYGIGVKEYIIKVRMEKAKELLLAGNSVKQTSELVGYSDEFSFSKAFKKHTNMSPLLYKKEPDRA